MNPNIGADSNSPLHKDFPISISVPIMERLSRWMINLSLRTPMVERDLEDHTTPVPEVVVPMEENIWADNRTTAAPIRTPATIEMDDATTPIPCSGAYTGPLHMGGNKGPVYFKVDLSQNRLYQKRLQRRRLQQQNATQDIVSNGDAASAGTPHDGKV